MRELRTFELNEPGRLVNWRARHDQRVLALEGVLWLTVEGVPCDIWLRPGTEHVLREGEMVWLSGEGGAARFVLSEPAAHWSAGRTLRLARRALARMTSTVAYGACPRAS
ncbi:DUF2917 domain-containing protein [Cupriavidus pampae]|jgi:hypothetical protein|uniref:DUF2917 domain-containing protein n=1 Tax=Cupriavidus pampae TaxID=659251 RepID=A0ABM8WSF5_9BURK|nr:DUF2917 domain-containing protein [Cupriavidus pampae]CAG9170394.1 hypothetical protein LMG32289_02138 [Cupriavidus pampae]